METLTADNTTHVWNHNEILEEVYDFMNEQVAEYKQYAVAHTDTIPAGPDTTKFRAMRSGMIQQERNLRVSGGYYGADWLFIEAVKIGGLVDSGIRSKMEAEFRSWLNDLLCTDISKTGYKTSDNCEVRVGSTSGTNWSSYGIEIRDLETRRLYSYTK